MAKLSSEDMDAVYNMRLLSEPQEIKKQASNIPLKFDIRKVQVSANC